MNNYEGFGLSHKLIDAVREAIKAESGESKKQPKSAKVEANNSTVNPVNAAFDAEDTKRTSDARVLTTTQARSVIQRIKDKARIANAAAKPNKSGEIMVVGKKPDRIEVRPKLNEDEVNEERKRTSAVASAFLAGKSSKQKELATNGNEITYHGNVIAKHVGDEVHVTTAGYGHSPSTRGHINGVLSRLGSPKLRQSKGNLMHGDTQVGSRDWIKVPNTRMTPVKESRISSVTGDEAGDSNIIMQMRKVISLNGRYKVKFTDGSTSDKITPATARTAIAKHNEYASPGTAGRDRQRFVMRLGRNEKMFTAAINATTPKATAEATSTMTKDPITGKVLSWSSVGDWKKITQKKNPIGKVTNLVGKALKTAKSLNKEEVELDEANPKGTVWKYKDARGVEHIGHMEKAVDRGGTDVSHYMRDRKTNELSIVSGSRSKEMKVHREEVEQAEQNEARIAMPLRGHTYHTKSDAELRYIRKDAGEAARAQKGMSSEPKYLDQVNDAETILHYRSKGGNRLTKQTEGAVMRAMEEVEQADEGFKSAKMEINRIKAARARNDAIAVAFNKKEKEKDTKKELPMRKEDAVMRAIKSMRTMKAKESTSY